MYMYIYIYISQYHSNRCKNLKKLQINEIKSADWKEAMIRSVETVM